jgi:hypothetical protein
VPGAGLDRRIKNTPTGIRSPDCPARKELLYPPSYPGLLRRINKHILIGKRNLDRPRNKWADQHTGRWNNAEMVSTDADDDDDYNSFMSVAFFSSVNVNLSHKRVVLNCTAHESFHSQ